VKVVRIHETGGPEEMRLDEVATPAPQRGEVLVRVEAAGVNFIDVYHRTGLYKVSLPYGLGLEGSGVVEAVGPDVDQPREGARVAWALVPGSYASHVVAPAERLVPVPASVDGRSAAALMLQGITAHYLSHSTRPLRHGDACLVHAGAGGVGLLLIQMAKMRGARVLATVSTEEKERLAREAGADEVILYTRSSFVEETRRFTGGMGVQVVYDSVGRDTFQGSLDCLAPRGMLVLFGQSSGPVPPLDLQVLNAKGSLFVTRPSMGHYVATRDELLSRCRDVFDWFAAGKLRLRIGATFPLAEAAEAHRQLEGRKTTGKVVLVP
jgi:NADPH2:quinone reductase